MPITRTSWVDDDGSGQVGTIINNAEKTILYNQIDALAGPWTAVPYNAAHLSAQSGWTISGLATLYWWRKIDRQCFLVITLNGTMTFGGTWYLRVAMPAPVPPSSGFTAASPFTYYGPGMVGTGIVDVTASGLTFLRDVGGTPYPAQTGQPVQLLGQLSYPIA